MVIYTHFDPCGAEMALAVDGAFSQNLEFTPEKMPFVRKKYLLLRAKMI